MPKNIATKEMELAWANAVSDNAEIAVNSVISSDSSDDLAEGIVAKCGSCGGTCGGGGQEVKGVEVDYGQIPSGLIPPDVGAPAMMEPAKPSEEEQYVLEAIGEMMQEQMKTREVLKNIESILSDIRDRFMNNGQAVSAVMPKSVVEASKGFDHNISNALMAALTISDKILAKKS